MIDIGQFTINVEAIKAEAIDTLDPLGGSMIHVEAIDNRHRGNGDLCAPQTYRVEHGLATSFPKG